MEGNSIRATARMTDVSKPTILKLLADVGKTCQTYHDQTVRNLVCKRIQCDEIWSFCYAKDKNVPKVKQGKFGYGSVWTWTAICADSKLVPSWLVAERNITAAQAFMGRSCKLVLPNLTITWCPGDLVTSSICAIIATSMQDTYLVVKVHPKAGKEVLIGTGPGRFEAWVKAKPMAGHANDAVVALLSRTLRIPAPSIRLIKGRMSRHKVFRILQT